MSDNKKYYYIKLKDNYFDQDNIKILESMENGHTYSLIILKLYLKSSKYDGCLMMTRNIPYSPDKIKILSNVIGHDIAHVKEAIRAAEELDLITIVDNEKIWMTDIQNFIGHSSTEADRVREYRSKVKSTNVQQLNDKSTPEIELDIEKELKLKKEKKQKKASPPKVKHLDFILLTHEEHIKLIKKYGESNSNLFIEKLNNYIGSTGKKYKSHYHTLLNWMRRDNIEEVKEVVAGDGFLPQEEIDKIENAKLERIRKNELDKI